MIAELDTLPDSGLFIVETAHSAYLINMDAKTFSRWPAAPEASTLNDDGDTVTFTEIRCVTNQSMRIYCASGRLITSTPVESIVEALR